MNTIRDNTGMVSWTSSAEDVSLIKEWGRFEGPREIRVGEEVITSDRIYINAGARPRIPEIPGLETVPWLDQSRLLELTELPEHLIILGGSYIALEFSQIFRRFGARVTVLERGSQLVFREDPDVAESIQDILELEGVEVCLDSSVVAAAEDGTGVGLRSNRAVPSVFSPAHTSSWRLGGFPTRTGSTPRPPESSSTSGASCKSTIFAALRPKVCSQWVTSTDTEPSRILR